MSVPPLITQAHLEARIGVSDVAKLCGSKGSPTGADPIKVRDVIQIGSDEAAGLLMPGFDVDGILALINNDTALQAHIAWIAIGLSGSGRSEFYQEGKFLFADPFARAIDKLTKIGTAKLRSVAEETTNHVNQTLHSVNASPRARTPHVGVFVDTTSRRGSGDF